MQRWMLGFVEVLFSPALALAQQTPSLPGELPREEDFKDTPVAELDQGVYWHVKDHGHSGQ
jgi:hypothetical protein